MEWILNEIGTAKKGCSNIAVEVLVCGYTEVNKLCSGTLYDCRLIVGLLESRIAILSRIL